MISTKNSRRGKNLAQLHRSLVFGPAGWFKNALKPPAEAMRTNQNKKLLPCETCAVFFVDNETQIPVEMSRSVYLGRPRTMLAHSRSRPRAVLLLFMATIALTSAFQSSFVTPSSIVKSEILVCPSLRASRHASEGRVHGISMGFRDKFKKLLGAVGAAITIGTAPSSASAASAAAAVAQPPAQEQTAQGPPPPMLLPSQVTYYKRMANGGDSEVVATAKRVVKSPKLWAAAGVVAVGGGAYIVSQNAEKKRGDDVSTQFIILRWPHSVRCVHEKMPIVVVFVTCRGNAVVFLAHTCRAFCIDSMDHAINSASTPMIILAVLVYHEI
jgi:hypothetical protein